MNQTEKEKVKSFFQDKMSEQLVIMGVIPEESIFHTIINRIDVSADIYIKLTNSGMESNEAKLKAMKFLLF